MTANNSHAQVAAANAHPPGELNRVEFTGDVAITATTEATAQVIVTAGSVTFAGETVDITFFTPAADAPSGTIGAYLDIVLWDSVAGASIGIMGRVRVPATGFQLSAPVRLTRRLTPAAGARTYSIRAYTSVNNNAGVHGGAGGAGNWMPGFIQITRA